MDPKTEVGIFRMYLGTGELHMDPKMEVCLYPWGGGGGAAACAPMARGGSTPPE
jgi:hypothetical protein